MLDAWYGVRVDDQSRRLKEHENDSRGNELGHTLRKHHNKGAYNVARRCETDISVRRKNSTSYRGGIAITSVKVKDVIQRNQKLINLYANGRATKSKFYGRLITARTALDYGESVGLDCKKFDKNHYFYYGRLKSYVGPELRHDYPWNVVSIKKKASERGGWFVYTSHPVLQGRL